MGVWAERRGDIARAMFYMDVRYEGVLREPGCDENEPDLILTNNIAQIRNGSPYMGLTCDLLRWHLQDPVDHREQRRNDIVFNSQLNRNPFVDRPAWIREVSSAIWPKCFPAVVFIPWVPR